MKDSPSPLLERFGLPACILVYVMLSLLTYNDIAEDAYIYFRFAENIAAGHGYVFNQGGTPVEAGTSPIWQFLIVLLTFLPIPLVTAVKFVGIFFGAIALALTARLGERFISDPVARLAPVLMTATSIPFVFWGHRGLETPLFASATLWATLCLTDPTPTRRWGLAATALFLARPEGAYLLLVLIPFFWLHRDRLAELAQPLLLLFGVALAVTVVRFFYFHDVVPQTFYMKVPSASGIRISGTDFYFRSAFLYAFAAPLLLCLPRRSFWSAERIVLVSILALLIGWSLMAMEFVKPHFRHLVALLPVFYVTCVGGLDYLLSGRTHRAFRPLLHIACVVLVVAVAAAPNTPTRNRRLQPNPYGTAIGHFLNDPAGYTSATLTKITSPSSFTSLDVTATHPIEQNYQVLVGRFLAENYPNGARIVYDQMGQTPYFAGADKIVVDSYGLTDKAVGFHAFASRADSSPVLRLYRWLLFDIAVPAMGWEDRPETAEQALDYLFDFDPDLILINQWVVRHGRKTLTAQLSRDERLEQRYVRRAALANLVVLYERKGAERRELRIPDGLQAYEF